MPAAVAASAPEPAGGGGEGTPPEGMPAVPAVAGGPVTLQAQIQAENDVAAADLKAREERERQKTSDREAALKTVRAPWTPVRSILDSVLGYL